MSLFNIVRAWNTHHLQDQVDQASADYPDAVMHRIGHKHINLRGVMTFDLTRHGPSLLGRTAAAISDRATGAQS